MKNYRILLILYCFVVLNAIILIAIILMASHMGDTSLRKLSIINIDTEEGNNFLLNLNVYEHELHLKVDEKLLWEPGNSASDLHSNILNTLVIELNHFSLPQQNYELMSQLSYLGYIDQNGNISGSYSDLTIQIDFRTFTRGEHRLEVQTQTISGKIFRIGLDVVIS